MLEQDGLPSVLDLLRHEIQRRNAGVVVLDGFSIIEEAAPSTGAFKKFIHELQAQATITDCTMFLLRGSYATGRGRAHAGGRGCRAAVKALRQRGPNAPCKCTSCRGSGYLRGEHSFRITANGLAVYPRTEAPSRMPELREVGLTGPPFASGIARLDRIMGGGFPHRSTALLIGPPGIGKTTLGLHFLSQCGPDAPGMLFGFYETPAAILDKATALGLPLTRLVEEGHVEIVWQPTTEGLLGRGLRPALFRRWRRRGVQRLFIDGFQGFEWAGSRTCDRLGPYLFGIQQRISLASASTRSTRRRPT